MLFHMVLILLKVTCTISNNAGSTLFYKRHTRECWSEDDIAKLRARKIFDQLIPPQVHPDRINVKYIKETLRYFKRALRYVEKDTDNRTANILKQALADAIGSHLRSEILPTVRFAYYAGYVPYKNVRELHDYLDEIKMFLNTQGLGWRKPDRVPQWSNLTVAKVLIGSGKLFDPCTYLVTKRDSNTCIHLPTPRLDDDIEPSAIALPFKSGGLVNLLSPKSNNVLLKYYTTASRCILRSSPENCRHSDFLSFNNELWHWMKRDVAPHIVDEKLYAAYGGVLRIAAAVQNYGKGLSRRNLFEYEDAGLKKWHPWRILTDSYIYINADWTPKLYVGFVLLAALAVCLLQVCYNYMFGDADACRCTGRSKKSSFTEEVTYANAEMKVPAMLPRQSAVYYSDKKRIIRSPSKPKTSSLGSIRTQKVYDLNENTEKLIAIIMSDNEDSVVGSGGSLGSKVGSDEQCDEDVIDVGLLMRPESPPKIETSICQIRIDRTPRSTNKTRKPMYSTSTLTHSDVTCRQEQHPSDSIWSATGSSTSGRSVSSTSSKSRRSRSSRDLAWARRVISKHSSRGLTKSTSRSELDVNSFTTPPSKR